MAREILSVPVSTVAWEANFSASGKVVSDKRCGLSPETVEALVCLKDWNLADTRQQEAELAEAFERLKLERPEWMPRSPPHDQQSTTSR
nr:putative ac9 transposase [Quercus suber]